MTDEELIKRALLDYPAYYLMYPGGTGGEFLSNLISIHSSKFRNKVSSHVNQNNNNRTHVFLLPFFQIVSSSRTKSLEFDDFVTAIKKQHNFLNYDIKEKTDEAIKYLNEDSKPPLIRCHVSTNSYFQKNNTYVILADNNKWHSYKEILLFLKALKNKHYCPTIEIKRKFFEYELSSSTNDIKLHNLYNSALDWVIKNDITEMYEMQLDVIKCSIDLNVTFAEIFKTNDDALFKKYNHIICDFESQYKYLYPKFNNKVITVIQYSKIFKKGYLENIFDIESDEFHEKLLNWHERNLELMSKNGFNYNEYKL
jgi:hypothetical protein